jgi:hypothetical protein
MKKPKLQTVQRGRTPLSPSLRPAKPPEEGERGVGRRPTTLKAQIERRAVREESGQFFRKPHGCISGV